MSNITVLKFGMHSVFWICGTIGAIVLNSPPIFIAPAIISIVIVIADAFA